MIKTFLILILIVVFASCSVEVKEKDSSTNGTSDGSAATPVELTVGTTKSGGIAYNGYSYYKFTTSSTGAGSYKLGITSMTITDGWSSNAVSTYLYSDSGYSSSSLIDWEGCETNCTVYFDYENLDANKSYYLKLSGFGTVTYDLTISRGGSEGSKNNPVELTLGSAQSGTIDNKAYYGYSFYKFTTSGADNYTLSMNNSDSLDCSLYSDSAYTSTVNWYYSDCTAGTNLTETFTGTSSSEGLSGNTSYYLRIEGELSTAKTTTYSITIAAEGN